jgi:NADH dehydrogenase
MGARNGENGALSSKSIEEATEIRHKILYAFEVAERVSDPAARASWLSFVILGVGATGVVELAGAIGRSPGRRSRPISINSS